jgi:predicted small lipoprotein YifL
MANFGIRTLVAFAFLLSVSGCGVKDDLEKPTAQTTAKTEKDSSKPPSPIGR